MIICKNYNSKLFRWYNFFKFNNDNNVFFYDEDLIKKTIIDIEFICNKSSYILTLKKFYNSLDKYNRNILHYIYLYNLDCSYIFLYITNNNLCSDYYIDIYGKKPFDYKCI